MSAEHEATETLDVKGLSCPMPVVKTKQTIDALDDGDVLEVLATDKGSMTDIRGWADTTGGVELLEQREVDDGGATVYQHFVRKGG